MNSATLPYPYGAPLFSAVLKSTPDDFRVSETLGFEPTGEGEHVFLEVEKTGLSTPELLTRLASDFRIHPRLLSYSGLKDKQAVTQQWISLHLPGRDPVRNIQQGDGYRILRQERHRSKLRRGTHKSNHFQIRLRDVADFPSDSKQQLESMMTAGMANYFGRQRFGRRDDNVAQALQQLTVRRVRGARKSMLLSALRSHLFNQILAQRIRLGYWQQPLTGDLFMLNGSHSIFSDSIDETLLRRFGSMDISSSASLYGSGETKLAGIPRQIEQQVFADHPEIIELLDKLGLKNQMRTLRIAIDDLNVEYNDSERVLELSARLPAGSYMTTLLDHFVDAVDAS